MATSVEVQATFGEPVVPGTLLMEVRNASNQIVPTWAFDEGAGTSTADATGGGHTGTLSNAVWSASGKYGSAIAFNGTSSLVRVADAPALDFTTGMTIEAWVLPSVLSGWRTVLLKERGNDLTYGLYARDNAPRPASYVSTGGIGLEATGTAGIPLNTWTHLAATYDGATLRLFVNGTQAGTRALRGAIAVTDGELTIGGNDPWGEFFAGSIDEVRLCNRPLTAAEIQSDMAVPLRGPPPSDTTQPVVSITAPANNSFARGTVTITQRRPTTPGRWRACSSSPMAHLSVPLTRPRRSVRCGAPWG